jgi:pimeloyl-ACP methyl ester carboxylesterase
MGSGPPLVLIHGIGSRWQVWAPVLDRLAAHHDVVALDLPGFGASALPPPGTPPGLESLTSLTLDFLRELGIERPHVAGNSLGGLISLELARRAAVSSATGLSPAGFASPAETVLARAELWSAVRLARLASPRATAIMRRPRVRALALRNLVAHPERMPPAAAADDVRALAAAPWFDATLPTIQPRAFRDGSGIAVPVTIAWGEHDRLLLPRQSRRAGTAIPSARLITLEGCGHVPTYDDPEQVARVILDTAASTFT